LSGLGPLGLRKAWLGISSYCRLIATTNCRRDNSTLHLWTEGGSVAALHLLAPLPTTGASFSKRVLCLYITCLCDICCHDRKKGPSFGREDWKENWGIGREETYFFFSCCRKREGNWLVSESSEREEEMKSPLCYHEHHDLWSLYICRVFTCVCVMALRLIISGHF
jgi:hypothetical protein